MPQHLLLVDGDPLIRRVLTLLLEDAGSAVGAASDGTAALSRVESTPPSAILPDLELAGLDGREFLRRLGQRPSPPPAIVFFGLFESRGAALALGATDVIATPLDIDALLLVIAHVLNAGGGADGAVGR